MTKQDDPMSFWLTPLALEGGVAIEFRGDHVHVQISRGMTVGSEQRNALWAKIARICEVHNTHRVLVEGPVPDGVFQTSEVIDAGLKAAAVPRLWMAMCFDNFQPDELTELYETVAASRGVRVKHFSNTERALLWLRSNTPT